MLESQMRKISLENSTMQMENKLLKDKYNRSAGAYLGQGCWQCDVCLFHLRKHSMFQCLWQPYNDLAMTMSIFVLKVVYVRFLFITLSLSSSEIPMYLIITFSLITRYILISLITARVTELEAKLSEQQTELCDLQARCDQETSRVTRSVRAEFERQLEQQQTKASTAVKEKEVLRTEVTIYFCFDK